MIARFGSAALALALLVAPARAAGPFDVPLFATTSAPTAKGSARLVFAESPFGVAVTADGHARYDVQITAANLPAPSSLGAYHAYIAWAVSTDLAHWQRLGAVTNGTSTVGHIELDKFLLVIAAEADSASTTHRGPSVLHGNSPSSWLQTFLAHSAFFHGVTD
jgi:hypothetical protein